MQRRPPPHSRLAPGWPVPPPWRVRVYTRAYARARRRARAAPGYLPLAHVWAHAPLCRPPRPVTFAPLAVRTAARRPAGSVQLVQAPAPCSRTPTGTFGLPARVSREYVPTSWHRGCSCCCCSAPAEPQTFTPLLCPLSPAHTLAGRPHLRVFSQGPCFCAAV